MRKETSPIFGSQYSQKSLNASIFKSDRKNVSARNFKDHKFEKFPIGAREADDEACRQGSAEGGGVTNSGNFQSAPTKQVFAGISKMRREYKAGRLHQSRVGLI